MAIADGPEDVEVHAELREERRRLAESLDELRSGIDDATDLRSQLAGRIAPVLPLALVATFAAGFVLAGGIGATVRLMLRISREGRVVATAGRFSLVEKR
jgi:hypothetical protein